MTILVPGDTFEFWSEDPLTGEHNTCRVIVTEPGSEPEVATQAAVDFANNVTSLSVFLMYLPPDRAQAIMDRVRGGGSAEDDEP